MVERNEYIEGFRGLADWLEQHPDVAVPPYTTQIQISTTDDDDANCRAVDAFALASGAEPQWNPEGVHYKAQVQFGPIEYCIVAVTKAHMADYREATRLGEEALVRQKAAEAYERSPQGLAAAAFAAEAAQGSDSCRRCRVFFDATDTRFDGHAQGAVAGFCRRCVDNCHEGDAGHRCVICTETAAIEEHHALEAAADADQAAGAEIDEAVETTGHLPGCEPIEDTLSDNPEGWEDSWDRERAEDDARLLDDDIDARRAEALAEELEQSPVPEWERLGLSHGQPIEAGDRVRVHANRAVPRDFPPYYEGAEGEVVKVELEPDVSLLDVATEPSEFPIEVRLDGVDVLQCFAVAEVDVIEAAADRPLIGGRS